MKSINAQSNSKENRESSIDETSDSNTKPNSKFVDLASLSSNFSGLEKRLGKTKAPLSSDSESDDDDDDLIKDTVALRALEACSFLNMGCHKEQGGNGKIK